jgi:hypothetical protein
METLIGIVTHYYTHLGVAIVKLQKDLQLGDALLFLGHTSDFSQVICSIEIEHHKQVAASAGTDVALKVDEAVRAGDKVYKIIAGAGDPTNHLLWKSMRQAEAAIVHTYQPVFASFTHENGLSDHGAGILLSALSLEPGVVSPDRLQVRGPYTSAGEWMTRLHESAGKGLLLEPEPGQFRLSRLGHNKAQKLIADGRAAMQRADTLLVEDSRRLCELLGRLVQASLMAPPPPDTWCIRLAYQLMPELAQPLPFIEQALSCLQAYRDDAHLAAWRPASVNGPALEALTLVWRGEAASVEEIYNRLAGRGFELHDYQREVDTLRQRGWVEGVDSALVLTAIGKVFRDQVEQDTDLYFFAPWDCLEAAEKTELSCLLAALREELIDKIAA